MNDRNSRERKEIYSIEQIKEATKDVLYKSNKERKFCLTETM